MKNDRLLALLFGRETVAVPMLLSAIFMLLFNNSILAGTALKRNRKNGRKIQLNSIEKNVGDLQQITATDSGPYASVRGLG